MIEIIIENEQLILDLKGLDQLWALKMKLEIPLENIVSAEPVDPHLEEWWKGVRLPGTHLPGLIVAGTFYEDGKRVFWNVKRGQEAVIIKLNDNRYDELIIGVEHAAAVVAQISAALPNR